MPPQGPETYPTQSQDEASQAKGYSTPSITSGLHITDRPELHRCVTGPQWPKQSTISLSDPWVCLECPQAVVAEDHSAALPPVGFGPGHLAENCEWPLHICEQNATPLKS